MLTLQELMEAYFPNTKGLPETIASLNEALEVIQDKGLDGRYVWSIADGEDLNDATVISDIHSQNVTGYLISEVPWQDGEVVEAVWTAPTVGLTQIAADNAYAFALTGPRYFDEPVKIKVLNDKGDLTIILKTEPGLEPGERELFVEVRSESGETLMSDGRQTVITDDSWFNYARDHGGPVYEYNEQGDNDPITVDPENDDMPVHQYIMTDNTVSIMYGDIIMNISQDDDALRILGEDIPFERKATLQDVNHFMPEIKKFMSPQQLSVVGSLLRGEEGQFFKNKLVEIGKTIRDMPETHGQDGKGDEAIAYIHFFRGSADWYLTEKDMDEDRQLQAFGQADLGYGPEMGYINLEELQHFGVEMDFHFKPTMIGELRESESHSPS